MTIIAPHADPAAYRQLGYSLLGRLIDDLAAARVSLAQQIAGLADDRRLEALIEPHVLASDWVTETCRRGPFGC